MHRPSRKSFAGDRGAAARMRASDSSSADPGGLSLGLGNHKKVLQDYTIFADSTLVFCVLTQYMMIFALCCGSIVLKCKYDLT